MALQKQPVEINFKNGVDTKTDPYQVPIGKFISLENSVFDKYARLTKRNGFGEITTITTPATYLTTFEGNLTGIGSTLQAYAEGSNSWVTKGNLQPLSLSVLSLIRANTEQTQADVAVSYNNFVCTVYTDTGSGSTIYKYVLADSVTGQNILAPAPIPSTASITTAPRVFFFNHYFIIGFTTSSALEYVVINALAPVAPTTATILSSSITPSSQINWDAVVSGSNLYFAWNGSDVGGAIRVAYLSPVLVLSSPTVIAGHKATLMSMSSDSVNDNIYVTFWDNADNNGYTAILNEFLGTVLAPTLIIASTVITNITGTVNNNLQTVFYEIPNNYGYDSSIPTHYVSSITITSTGTISSPHIVARSVGLASKAFMINDVIYFLAVYHSVFQPTYFLLNALGQVISRLAYSNAGGYKTTGLPGYNIFGQQVTIGYEYADLIEAVNKTQGVTNAAGVYSQTGLNAVTFTFGTQPISSEIGETLNLTGGFLWSYDGYSPVENNFFLWPDNVEATTATTGGNLAAQVYFYQVIYEWMDNQGNINRSAPSIPLEVDASSSMTSTNANTINIPTLRLTYKIANPVKISIFRWSTGQQNYFEVTSITTPLFNNTSIDYVTFVDTQSDSSIAGNALIYTTGGVIEDIGAPSFNSLTLFDDRLWGIDAEDTNLLWYSKQVIETTPVEMSDLFTLYVAPTISVQGSSGQLKCLSPMDDKLIMFKSDAIYYLNGTGPDNTGSNSQYSQPTFITGAVGTTNQQSIVLIPTGLMFQSDKGIWLLDRSLNTSYIGAPVEDYTLSSKVLSAVSVIGTNQVRFTMDSGVTLMYDYFFQQWSTFNGIPAISSTTYNGLHTYLDSSSRIFQETPGLYLDGSNPVLQSFTTSWINANQLQGYIRGYFLFLLGTYKSPHKLQIGLAYDYDSNIQQSSTISPSNYAAPWGVDTPWGGDGAWGGSTDVEQARVFFDKQRCQAFQVSVQEIYDPSFGGIAGEGLTLSGLNMVIGVKKNFPTPAASQSFG
jgi:hypothetical protein